jgi:competence ComEA-like helix-hairpin-helix protein
MFSTESVEKLCGKTTLEVLKRLIYKELLAFCTLKLHNKMSFHKSNYINIYTWQHKLLLSTFFCLLLACGGKNDVKQFLSSENQFQISESAININTASAAELEKIPHIGAKTAHEIIEHREKFGKFRKPEHLLLIPRISDKRFREIRALIKTE